MYCPSSYCSRERLAEGRSRYVEDLLLRLLRRIIDTLLKDGNPTLGPIPLEIHYAVEQYKELARTLDIENQTEHAFEPLVETEQVDQPSSTIDCSDGSGVSLAWICEKSLSLTTAISFLAT